MTPEAQRIAIAEACGWRFVSDFMTGDEPDFQSRKKCAILCWVRPGNARHQQEELPDYLGSLDAMHEAEKIGPSLDGWDDEFYLKSILDHRGFAHTASAAKRAEAFLRTLSLWKP